MNRTIRSKIRERKNEQKAAQVSLRSQAEERITEANRISAQRLIADSIKQRAKSRVVVVNPLPNLGFDETRYIAKHASRLYKSDMVGNLGAVLRYLPFARAILDWKPRGKSAETLLRSLIDHVISTFPMPSILHTVFLGAEHNRALQDLAVNLARGGSLVEAVKEGRLTAPLTRKMCHEVLKVAGGTFIGAVRWVQMGGKGSRQLHQAWMATRFGSSFGSLEAERFWQTVLDWFCRASMLNPSQVGPMCDYIAHCRNENPGWEIKGRSPIALIRLMEVWHADLTRVSVSRNQYHDYIPSGIGEAKYDESVYDENQLPKKVSIFRIEEILNSKALAEEGRAMSHCVWSYESWILRKETSIFSMTHEDGLGATGNWQSLTVQINLSTRRIVQARGRFNRSASAKESQILHRWAREQKLLY